MNTHHGNIYYIVYDCTDKQDINKRAICFRMFCDNMAGFFGGQDDGGMHRRNVITNLKEIMRRLKQRPRNYNVLRINIHAAKLANCIFC